MHRLWIVALATAVTASAQRPNFSGTWASAPAGAPTVAAAGDAGFRRGEMESGWASTITLAQSTDSLIVSYVFFSAYDLQPPVRLAFAMDGTESKNAVILGHATELRRSRLGFEGSKMVITTLYPAPTGVNGGDPIEVRQTLSLESPMALSIETTRAGVMGGAASTSRTVYSKRP